MTTTPRTATNTTADVARLWLESGVSIVPMRLDGSKAPQFAWAELQTRLPTEWEVDDWFSRPAGIGAICGAVSGGMEVIDFDDGDLFDPWRQLVENVVNRLPVVETGGGGYHVVYRCSEVCGNYKLAVDPARKKQTLIETRGEGGLIVAIGSPLTVHASGQPYIQATGPVLPDEIPVITPAERAALWAAARTFDLSGERERIKAEYLKSLQPKKQPVRRDGEVPPWEDFDQRADFPAILQSAGWKSADGEHWTRPGKGSGVSATLRLADSGCPVLCVFSSNAGFALDASGHCTMGASAFITRTRFAGDWKESARWMKTEGFGHG